MPSPCAMPTFSSNPFRLMVARRTPAQSAYLFKVDILQRLSGVDFINGAQGGFHDTTRRTEDDTGAGRFSHRQLSNGLYQSRRVKPMLARLYQACQFAGGDGVIDVGDHRLL